MHDNIYYWKCDNPLSDDDYLLAESALMRLADGAGVPAPRVLHTDISRASCPPRFQIMEHFTDPASNMPHKAGTLDIVGWHGNGVGNCAGCTRHGKRAGLQLRSGIRGDRPWHRYRLPEEQTGSRLH